MKCLLLVLGLVASSNAYSCAMLDALGISLERCAGGSRTVEEDISNCKADIAFLLDGSGSVKPENWKLMLRFVNSFAERLNLGVDKNEIAVVDFGNVGEVQIKLGELNNIQDFQREVLEIPFKDQNTNTADGLRKLREVFEVRNGDRPDVPNIAIIVTDGVATMETDKTLLEASALRAQGVTLFGLGIGAQLDTSELVNIIQDEDKVLKISDFNALALNLETLLSSAFSSVTDAVPTQGPPPHSWDPCKGREVALVLDSSGSIGESGFQRVKALAKNFVNRLEVGPLNTGVAIVIFSTKSYVKLHFGEEVSKDQIIRIIDNLEYLGGRTNVSGAVWTLAEKVYPDARLPHGRDTNRIAVVITDTQSNVEHYTLPMNVYNAKINNAIRLIVLAVFPDVAMPTVSMIANNPLEYHLHYVDDLEELVRSDNWLFEHACQTEEFPLPDFKPEPQYLEGDVIIAIDSSISLGEEQFLKQRELIKNMIMNTTVQNVHFSVVLFGRSARTLIRFDDYNDMNSLMFRINQLRYSSEDFNIGSGLDEVEQVLQSRGARPNVPKMLVIFTSGNEIISENLISSKLQTLKALAPELKVMVVGMGEKIKEKMHILKELVSEPASLYMMVEPDMDLMLHKGEMLASLISTTIGKIMWQCNFETYEYLGVNADGFVIENKEPSTCDLIQGIDDDFDWLVIEGETPSLETGPAKAYNGSYYAYIEATGKLPGSKASLMGEWNDFSYSGPMCLMFWYNMNGWHTGRLEVYGRSSEFFEYERLWTMYGHQGTDWHMGMVKLNKGSSKYQYKFVATRADEFSGDISLDALSLHYGPCIMRAQFDAEEAMYYKSYH